MHLKDYYSILELKPSATLPEIRKAYRRLAQLHHPDKNNNDPLSQAMFAAIKEAYEVLTDPAKKEYYLQQRWYDQSIGKRKTQDIITPVTILKQTLELERYTSQLDVFRMDKQGLQEYMLGLFTDATINTLHTFNEPATIREILAIAIRSMKPLPWAYTTPVIDQLKKLAGKDEQAQVQLTGFEQQHQKTARRDKYSLIAIILLTVALCLLIWLAGSRY